MKVEYTKLALADLRKIAADSREYGDVVAASVEARITVEIGRAQFQLRDVAQPQHGPVRIGAHDDVGELLGRTQAALGLNVEL